jgi:peptidoglycan/LPS O-acetylase OafA/YrhL
MHKGELQYRPEIDGLRAAAVLPVILFHAGIPTFRGGFVGVDIFFVISGYLITRILADDLNAGRYSLARFYERRARRILPALFFVATICSGVAWALMLPHDFDRFSASVASLALFGSNFFFWLRSGYFDPSAAESPMIHTWSLAVEEQFYIVFPLLLAWLWHSGSRERVVAALWAAALVSFGLCLWGSVNASSANFYLAPFRAWELLAGALCALATAPRVTRPALGVLGVALIGFAIFWLDEKTPFPSAYALLPVIGAILIIRYAVTGTPAARVLSLRPVVAIGLVSYSAYLWHQPLFAFARLSTTAAPSQTQMLLLSAATMVLAAATYVLIEQPFRGHKLRVPQNFVLRGAAMVIVLMLVVGVSGILVSQVHGRDLRKRVGANWGLDKTCDGALGAPQCQTSTAPEVAVWGDSFAMHLIEGFRLNATPAFIQMTMAGCTPNLGNLSFGKSCEAFNAQVIDQLRARSSIHTVIIATPFDHTVYGGSDTGRLDEVLESYRKTIKLLRAAGKRVVFVAPPPLDGTNLGRCLSRAHWYGRSLKSCDFDKAAMSPSARAARQLLQRLAPEVPIVWLDPLLCGTDKCAAAIGEIFVFRDEAHLTREGSRYLGEHYDLYSQALAAAR